MHPSAARLVRFAGSATDSCLFFFQISSLVGAGAGPLLEYALGSGGVAGRDAKTPSSILHYRIDGPAGFLDGTDEAMRYTKDRK